MEFDPPENIQQSPVSNDERIAAQMRQKTLEPMDPFLKPEDAPDPIVVNVPQANIERDSEDTAQRSSLIQPSMGIQPVSPPSSQSNKARAVILMVAIGLVFTGIAFTLVFTKTQ